MEVRESSGALALKPPGGCFLAQGSEQSWLDMQSLPLELNPMDTVPEPSPTLAIPPDKTSHLRMAVLQPCFFPAETGRPQCQSSPCGGAYRGGSRGG